MKTTRCAIVAALVLAVLSFVPVGVAPSFADAVSGDVKASDYSGKTLTITDKATLTVDKDTTIAAIDAPKCTLAIKGSKSLTVQRGIKVKQLSIQDATVVSTGSSAGIQAAGSISIDGASVIAKGADYGMKAGENISIKDEDSVVSAQGGKGALTSSGGKIVLADSLVFSEPNGVTLASNGKSVVNAQGAAVTKLKVQQDGQTQTLTVSFDANGHGTAPADQVVKAGEKAKKPDDLEAEGFDFGGWFSEKECTTAYDFDQAVTKDLELFAKWTVHTHAIVEVKAEAATCTEDGILRHWKCTTCGKLFSDEEGKSETTEEAVTIKAAHELVETPAKAATCAEDGNIRYWTCSVCKKLFKDEAATQEIAQADTVVKAAHELVETPAKDATCTEDGNIQYWTCSACGKLFEDKDAAKEITDKATITVKASGHTPAHIDAVAATCTAAGNKEYWKCSECGKLFSDSAATSEIEESSTVVAALGHELSHTEAKAATCTEAGNREYWHCSRCDRYFLDSEAATQTSKSGTVISALGHSLVQTKAKAATCTAAGTIEYWKCSRCGAYFKDAAGSQAIQQADTVVKATGHAWGSWTVVRQPTTTQEGLERRVCGNDSTHVETRTVPKKTAAVTYTFTKGASPTWTKGSNTPVSFTIERSDNSAATYAHFKGITVDGRTLAASSYTARSGSLNVTVNASYLETLSTGTHPLVVNFDDGTASTSLTVKAAANGGKGSSGNKTPTTGDLLPVGIVGGVALIALVVACVAFFARKRSR